MGLQKYRADESSEPCRNGAVAWYARWMGGPSLALIRNCPIKNLPGEIAPRTVYIQGDPDTFFSLPAACKVRGQKITGFVTCEDGEWTFHAHTDQAAKIAR